MKFKAPFDGQLIVSLGGYTGDWDLAVEHQGRLTFAESFSPDNANPETFDVEVRHGQTINMFACNFSGGLEAELSYDFIHAVLSRVEQPNLRTNEEETHDYIGPCLYSPYSQTAACTAPWGVVDLIPQRGYVGIEARDASGASVPLLLVEDRSNMDPTRFRLTFFCSETKRPLVLLPGADYVYVLVLSGLLYPSVCPGAPTLPTSGEVSVTYFDSAG